MDQHETEQDRFIQDNTGHNYRVHIREDLFWRFQLWDGPVCVGHAYCGASPPILYLHDLHIRNDVLRPESGFRRVLRRLLQCPAPMINYRGRGLGSVLLQFITGRAKGQGFQAIEGSLSPHDLRDNPTLPQWYQQRGFTIGIGGQYGPGRIRLDLRLSEPEPGSTGA